MAVLVFALAGCAKNSELSKIEYTIFPKENVPYDDNELYVGLKDGYELTDPNVLRTDRIGFASNSKDKNKPIQIRDIYFFTNAYFRVDFVDNNKDQILIAMNQWIMLEIVDFVEPHYHPETSDEGFSISDVPPNDSYYNSQWGLFSNYGSNIVGAWQYATADSTPRIK